MTILEVFLVIIATGFTALVSILIAALLKHGKALFTLEGDLHNLSVETTDLIIKINALTTDLIQKCQALNFLMKPLMFFNKLSSSKNKLPTLRHPPQPRSCVKSIRSSMTSRLSAKEERKNE